MKWIIDYLYPRNFDHSGIPDLDGKVILITGGCSGLGFEVAQQCARHNASKIIIVSLPSPRLEQAVESLTTALTNPHGTLPGDNWR
jgi:NAD(P)-dependent dehydrogenase (short-subunit alcohol dehydrogenase family)